MKKPIVFIFVFAILGYIILTVNSCQKIKLGVVEFKRDYLDPTVDDSYFGAFAEDVDNLVTENAPTDKPRLIEVTPTHKTYSYYIADEDLKQLGYTEKADPDSYKEASTVYRSKEGDSKKGAGGWWTKWWYQLWLC